MGARPDLWRRVHARLGALGWTTDDLARRYYGGAYTPAERTAFAAWLAERPGRRPPPDFRAHLCELLALPPGSLDECADPRALVSDWYTRPD